MTFKKGQSGNPKGRSPRPVEVKEHARFRKHFGPSAEADVVKAVIAAAKEGNLQAATWLWERKYGKPSDQPQPSRPTTIRVEYGDHQPAVPPALPAPTTLEDR